MINHKIENMKTILGICENFLKLYFGTEGEEPAKRDLGLRLVSLGNPEKTVQGELLSFFNSESKVYRMVSECGIFNRDQRRSLDLTVFDQNWQTICVIEMKHYSSNQGRLNYLISGLQFDLNRHDEIFEKKQIPLIQIGLYTEIVDINNPFVNEEEKRTVAGGLYRFVKTYCDNARNLPKTEIPKDLDGYSFVSPSLSRLNIDDKHCVQGRVHYCIRIIGNS